MHGERLLEFSTLRHHTMCNLTTHHIESHWPKLLALHHNAVEMAETEQNAPCLCFRLIDHFTLETAECTLQVRLQARRWLIGQFDATIQNTDGNALRRITRQEQTEAFVLGSKRIE